MELFLRKIIICRYLVDWTKDSLKHMIFAEIEETDRFENSTSTSIKTFDLLLLDSIEQVQLIPFGYSYGNMGLTMFTLFVDIKLLFEHTSTIVEPRENIEIKKFISSFTLSIVYVQCIDKK